MSFNNIPKLTDSFPRVVTDEYGSLLAITRGFLPGPHDKLGTLGCTRGVHAHKPPATSWPPCLPGCTLPIPNRGRSMDTQDLPPFGFGVPCNYGRTVHRVVGELWSCI